MEIYIEFKTITDTYAIDLSCKTL